MFKLLFSRIICFTVVILLLLVKTSFSQNENADYLIFKKLYTNADGLPSREITCATQDNIGYMWFGTRNGLCRFDGNTFLVFNTSNSRLNYNNIKSIYFDNNEGIIVNFNSNTGYYLGLIHKLQVINTKTLEIKKFDDYYTNCPFKEKQIADILISTNSNSLRFRLKPYDNIYLDSIGSYKTYQLTNHLKFNKLDCHITKTISFQKKGDDDTPVIENVTHKLNVKESAFFIDRQKEIIQNILFPLPISRVYKDENYCVFTYQTKNGIFHYYLADGTGHVAPFEENRIFKGHLFNKNFAYHHINGSNLTLEIDNRNAWRLVHLNRPDIIFMDSLDIEQYQRAKFIYAFKDNLNNYWFCTTEGIIKSTIEKKNFVKHFTLSQYPQILNHSIRGILKTGDETIISTPDAVIVDRNRKMETIPNQRNFGIINHYGDVLIAGGNSVIRRNMVANTNQVHHFLDLGEVWSLLSVDTNTVIVFGIEQIIKYNLKTKARATILSKCKIRPNACYRVVREKKGNYLLVGESGIFILNKNFEIENDFRNDSTNKQFYLPISHVNDVHIDLKDKNIYWLATAYDGLYQWNRSLHKFTKYGLSSGFLSEVCYRIEEDAYNNLWVSTDYGIAKFNKNTKEAIVYTEKDGIAHNEFNRASSYVDKDGLMYFGGIDGYTTFNPKDFISDKKESAPLVVTKINSFNIETNSEEEELNNYRNDAFLQLTRNKKNLTINVALLDYETRQHQYAYQIHGYNNQWQYTTEGRISINGLPYGNYTLVIKAQSAHGIWLTDKMIKIPIEVIRPYYETWWFYSLIALVTILAIALAFYLVYKTKLRNLKRLADLRLTIASDLHDQVGGLLNKAAIQSELMQSKQKENDAALSKIALNNRTALSSMRDIIWNLDPRNDNSESLVDRMNDYAQKMLEDDFDYTINVQAIENVKLSHEIRQNLNMIFKESINNIVKHAANSKVNIELKIINGVIVLTVFNSGNYNLSEKRLGQGLWNMEMRVKKMKGQFKISFDDGVEICVTVPISH